MDASARPVNLPHSILITPNSNIVVNAICRLTAHFATSSNLKNKNQLFYSPWFGLNIFGPRYKFHPPKSNRRTIGLPILSKFIHFLPTYLKMCPIIFVWGITLEDPNTLASFSSGLINPPFPPTLVCRSCFLM